MGCHAQVSQLPSGALLPELGQASLALALASLPLARRTGSQARSLERSGYLTSQPREASLLSSSQASRSLVETLQ